MRHHGVAHYSFDSDEPEKVAAEVMRLLEPFGFVCGFTHASSVEETECDRCDHVRMEKLQAALDDYNRHNSSLLLRIIDEALAAGEESGDI